MDLREVVMDVCFAHCDPLLSELAQYFPSHDVLLICVLGKFRQSCMSMSNVEHAVLGSPRFVRIEF